jgi:hypothetical protein
MFALLSFLSLGPQLQAAPSQFTVDPTRSKLTATGTVSGSAIQQQGPGSLITAFSGTILANVSSDGVQFPGGSSINGDTNGVWQPGVGGTAGSAPADYAAQATVVFGTILGAVRNVELDVSSGVLPITSGQFDASGLLFSIKTSPKASFDYTAGFFGSGTVVLSGLSTNKVVNGASLTPVSGVQTLSIQIDTTFLFTALQTNDSSIHLTGTLVATQGPQRPPGVTIGSIQLQNQTVTLQVQNATTTTSVQSSTDLKAWAPQPSSRSDSGGVATFTFNSTARNNFFRVTQ